MTLLLLSFLFLLTILSVAAIWHMDVNHNLDRLGGEKTRGIFKITPEKAFRYSEYFLLILILLYDILLTYLILAKEF